jgi:hypothetical protein
LAFANFNGSAGTDRWQSSQTQPVGDFEMTKLNKTQVAAINTVIAFDTQEDTFNRTQAERFARDAAKLRKGVQLIVSQVGTLTGNPRKAKLSAIGAGWIAENSKLRDIMAAYAKFAGDDGEAIVNKAKAGKLGKCSTIRGAVASHEADIKPKASRKPKSGQGKSPAKKEVSFVAKKKPTTLAAKLELLEQFSEANGFSFTDFVAEWTAEATEGNATLEGKIASNG